MKLFRKKFALVVAVVVVHPLGQSFQGMTEQTPGLGTKLFNELTSSYAYSRQGDKNLLTFTVRSAPPTS